MTQDEELLRTGKHILNQLELHLYPSGNMGWCLTNRVPLYGRTHRVVGLVGISKDLHAPIVNIALDCGYSDRSTP